MRRVLTSPILAVVLLVTNIGLIVFIKKHFTETKSTKLQTSYVDEGKALFNALKMINPDLKHLGYINNETGKLVVVSIEADSTFSELDAEIELELPDSIQSGMYVQTAMRGMREDGSDMTVTITKDGFNGYPSVRLKMKIGGKELYQFVGNNHAETLFLYIGKINPPAVG